MPSINSAFVALAKAAPRELEAFKQAINQTMQSGANGGKASMQVAPLALGGHTIGILRFAADVEVYADNIVKGQRGSNQTAV